MNLEKVVFGFFVLLAATLNFGFFLGDINDPAVHNSWELFSALVVALITTILKFGDSTQLGAVHLATSLVALLQLAAAAGMWVWATNVSPNGLDAHNTASVVSLSGGALLANLVSVTLLVVETAGQRVVETGQQCAPSRLAACQSAQRDEALLVVGVAVGPDPLQCVGPAEFGARRQEFEREQPLRTALAVEHRQDRGSVAGLEQGGDQRVAAAQGPLVEARGIGEELLDQGTIALSEAGAEQLGRGVGQRA